MSINRRDFLSLCLKGSVSAAALTSLQLQALTGATNAIELGDYKALVCVYLYGGNDSLNMLVPLEGEQRNLYEQSRQNLAVASPIELSIKNQFAGGVGIHPSLAPIQSVFESQNLAFVGGVGTLLTPTSLDDYKNKAVPLPQHLFSHNDQQASWMYGRERESLNTGWGARLLERLAVHDEFAANISLDGTNLWQTGTSTNAFALNKSGISTINAFGGYQPRTEHVTSIMNRILGNTNHVLGTAYANGLNSAINNTQSMNNALEDAPEFITSFSETSFSEQLAAVAKTISVQAKLNTQRQVFFVSMGGFDTHDDQLTTHPALLNTLASGFNEFNSAMNELGMSDKVTTFTMSDFGRTLTSNGDGTDHGWAGNQIVMGGAVKGQNIYGELLTQQLDGPQDTGGGRLIPQVANEQYFATLAQWFGVPSSELVDIFPNLSNFNNTTLDFFV
ncbi:hypothetical protein PC2016_0902 [Pseudoalteromonas carrageenovora]|uniref:Tat pathway signal protein n=1 Tax=Pseudoalteromonas carrageenovora IAM 12662 TaxID=1314868 RepID=A0A2K4X7E3_PSEVC|nr:DUF1501 domain-containing protein [Pseudoalteromonas carrageenovora]MBE0382425.1 hypothetical protein [Pseudoalteromonas carrageenovora IAM 12662]QBJ71139.1 hypothetical protein PC2016_0902 [Pseudoalteromonas carrageenovora]GEB69566.1 Tat pathway signal protein [Pseudoalteromonas carrageenovora]SOU40213.1 conserved exported protein of unknown function [Pseudoalteromonas carrageenovora IAM 12662]